MAWGGPGRGGAAGSAALAMLLLVLVPQSAAQAGSAMPDLLRGPRAGAPRAAAEAGTVAIAGTAQVGRQLSVVTAGWPDGLLLTRQWYADGVALPGETAPTLTLTPARLGAMVTVAVTWTDEAGGPTSLTSAPVGPVAAAVFATAPTPTISGTLRVGRVLTADPGTWSPTATPAYQWRVNGAVVTGATGRSFTVRAGDRTKRISVTVTGRRAGYTTVSRTSAQTGVIDYGLFSAPAPTISGTPQIGATLTAQAGTWKPSAYLTYRWRLNGVAIAGATAKTYKVPSTAYGKRISVTVAGSRTAYTPARRTSAQTVPVTKPFSSTVAPKISGRLYRVGWVLTASVGPWSPTATFSYQWRREGKAIAGATGKSHRLTLADRGMRMSVSVTGHSSGRTPTRRTSAFTGTIGAAPYGFTDNGRPATPPVADYATARITTLTDAQWAKITASGVWRSGQCPGSRSTFRRVTVSYWGLDGKTHRGHLNVNADVAHSTAKAFEALYAKHFPMHRVEGIEHFGGWEWLASLGNVTTSMNCRKPSEANSSNTYSPHAWGRAVDINPVQNPYVNPRTGTWDPGAPAPATAPGTIRYGGTVWTIFRNLGWYWSGSDSWKDYMHFDTGYPSRTRTGLSSPLAGDLIDPVAAALGTTESAASSDK